MRGRDWREGGEGGKGGKSAGKGEPWIEQSYEKGHEGQKRGRKEEGRKTVKGVRQGDPLEKKSPGKGPN